MTNEHPSHPDQLMARARGVCWHSPTSDRWSCGPKGVSESLTPTIESATERSQRRHAVCDRDPIECNHEAALREAEEKLRAWLHKVALYSNDGWLAQEARARYVAMTGEEPPL